MRSLTVPVLLALLLPAACGTAETTTFLQPPETPGGRMCVKQCRESKDFCREACALDQRRCTNAMQAQAIRDYETYVRDQFRAKAPLELQPRDFERPSLCLPAACNKDCDRSHQACYEKCGGTVVLSSSCRFFCF